MSWFPRSAAPDDVRTVPPPGRWAAEEIHALLNDPAALEWHDRVGVVGRADGSAKPSTRLLLSRGQVAKTRLDYASASEELLRRELLVSRAPGVRASLWHPDKHWAIVRSEGAWYPLTLCPELRTLRQIPDAGGRMDAWLEMLRMAARVFAHHGLGLDLNPANFGVETGQERLYYIDDEHYGSLGERDIAGAMVARIPEEPEIAPEVWRDWASAVAGMLEQERTLAFDRQRLLEELGRYPVTEQFEAARAAVVEGVRSSAVKRVAAKRAVGRPSPRLTCVLADVHGNLPALEATLKAARELGADSYLFLGDAVGYGPHPAECVARLAELPNASFVRGNHDHAVGTGRLEVGMNGLARRCAEWTISVLEPAELEWLGTLPVELATEQWIAVHGAPRDPKKFLAYVYELTYEDNLRYLRQREVPVCFYGHTHVQLVHLELPSGPTKLTKPERCDLGVGGAKLINPGSVGQPRDGDPRAAFALWDRASQRVSFHRCPYDIDRTLSDLRAFELPAELLDRLCRGA